MNFRPLHDRVVVRRIEEEPKPQVVSSFPTPPQEKPMEGEVVAVGAGARDEHGKLMPLTSRPAIRFCSANGRAPRSRLMVRNC